MNGDIYNFQKLTPIKNANLDIYDDALNFVFNNDDIKNVAISGAYSAGKSSILETYKNVHHEYHFINISLAHFESTTQSNDDTKANESILEGKILNQLIHQIDPEQIPQTKFKVKQKIAIDKIMKNAAIVMIFLISSVYLVSFKNWCQFVSDLSKSGLKNLLACTTNSNLRFLSGIICAGILGFAVYLIIKTQNYKSIFRKVNLLGNEIEVFEKKEEAYFDKYLNEVLYLFENSNAHVIVFEDLDRYNSNQIFEKLREINTLINNRKVKPIRFFYLLRDDIFNNTKDRTKFFDFIIPVVPVIDSSNSYDQFIKHFKKVGIFEEFNENFLQELSLYIDDMRILKNIYNEFVIYYKRISSTEQDNNKLLAIITYKNIFPKDFSDLQLGLGFVHTLFEKKSEFVEQKLQAIDLKIQKINDEIDLTNKELLDTIDELDAAYLLSNYQITSVNGKNISAYKTRKELVKAMRESPNSVQHHIDYEVRQIDMTSEFKQLEQNPEYIERKKAIERRTGNEIDKLKAEIQNLDKQKSIIQNGRLQEIIGKDNIDTIFSVNFKNEIGETTNDFKEIKTSPSFPLIRYLIRNGYIDETYPDYMTYFYENSLSRIDKVFQRSITDQIPKEYSYSLKEPRVVLSRLRITDFDHEESLNFDLLCYLLETKQKDKDATYLTRFMEQLIRTKNYKFIGEFLDTKRNTDVFIELINHLWPGIFQGIHNESNFDDDQKKQYVIDTMYFSADADIRAININNCLTDFISNNPTFLDIVNPNIDKIISGFSLIDVQFLWVDYSTSNKELFHAVYTNNMYQLSFVLISLMLEKIYNLTPKDDFKSRNYTLISSKPEEPLVTYVNENIDHYIDVVLKNCDKTITDEESMVLAILNNEKVKTDKKKEYIRFLQTVIENIDKVINKELWGLILEQKCVKYSTENILTYFFQNEKELDSFLIKFINNYSDNLNFNKNSIDSKFGENSASDFFDAIIICNELSNERYTHILRALNYHYISFSIKDIAEEKVLILIRLNIIQMKTPELLFMRKNYPNQVMPFITQNIAQYTENVINEDNLDFNEMLSVLEENVAEKYKINLLKCTTGKISVQQKKYSVVVKKHILENNLDVADIPFLLKSFPNESNNVKEIIKHISVKNITEIIKQKYSIPFELLSELLAMQELTEERKKELFLLCLPNMNEEQAKKSLSVIHMNDFLRLFAQKRPKFVNNSTTKQILTIFQEKSWITRFEIDKDDSGYYRAFGRKTVIEEIASSQEK
ncbi:MAG TPA: hypothetical protein DDW65_08535 [Firmicutes bacterium]|nr:hypothetical protein [Bacillota bacterium]